MKSPWKQLVGLAVIAVATAALVFAYTRMSQERTAEAAGETAIASESRVRQDANGKTTVNLDADTQKLIGLQVVSLLATTRKQEVKAYGRALDFLVKSRPLAPQWRHRAKIISGSRLFLGRIKTLRPKRWKLPKPQCNMT